MATKSKKTPSYDLKAADRRRNVMIQVGLTAIVVIFAVVLVVYIVTSGSNKPAGGEAKAIRVATSDVITKEGTTEPKAVVSLYEDFLCPVCGRFEQQFGPTISKLIDSGAIATDFYMVAILDRPANQNYSSRAGAAAYCVADEDTTPDKQAFRRFHAAMYAQQPERDRDVVPRQRAADRDRASGRRSRRRAGLHQQRPLPGHGRRSRRRDRRHRHADGADQW